VIDVQSLPPSSGRRSRVREGRSLRVGHRRASPPRALRKAIGLVGRDELERFLKARGDTLLRQAVLLTGSRESGQDLLQEALVRLLAHWHQVDGDPEGYLRRTLYNLATDRWRYQARRREILVAEPPELRAVELECPVSVDCFRLDQNSLDTFHLEHLLVFDRGKISEG